MSAAPNDGESSDTSSVNYGSYLSLDELLQLQRPRSAPQHADELLSIVVHQASELWFKAILFELDQLTAALEHFDAGRALWHMGRLNALMRIVSAKSVKSKGNKSASASRSTAVPTVCESVRPYVRSVSEKCVYQ